MIDRAAQRIGAATARLFVKRGAKVVIGDIPMEMGEAPMQELDDAAVFVKLDA